MIQNDDRPHIRACHSMELLETVTGENRTRILVTNMFNVWNHGEMLILRAITSFLGKSDRDIILSCPYSIMDKKLLPESVRYVGRESRKSWGITYYINSVINLFYLLREIKRCDVVLDVGGDTISDNDGIKYTFAHCLPLLLAHLFSKPVIILPQTILPFKHRFTRSLARVTLNNSLAVFVREKGSYDYLKSLGIKADKVSFGCAFYRGQYEGSRSNLIGINFSRYLYRRSSHHIHVLKFLKELNEEIVYIPHVLADEPRSDYTLCIAFSHECKGRVFLSDAEETRNFISTLKIFIGERYHSIISALSTYTPVLAISNSFKVKSLMKDLGLEEYLVDPFDQNFEGIFKEKVLKILNSHDTLSRDLRPKISYVQRSVCELLETVDKCIIALGRLK